MPKYDEKVVWVLEEAAELASCYKDYIDVVVAGGSAFCSEWSKYNETYNKATSDVRSIFHGGYYLTEDTNFEGAVSEFQGDEVASMLLTEAYA